MHTESTLAPFIIERPHDLYNFNIKLPIILLVIKQLNKIWENTF